jgi:hypothetical protein
MRALAILLLLTTLGCGQQSQTPAPPLGAWEVVDAATTVKTLLHAHLKLDKDDSLVRRWPDEWTELQTTVWKNTVYEFKSDGSVASDGLRGWTRGTWARVEDEVNVSVDLGDGKPHSERLVFRVRGDGLRLVYHLDAVEIPLKRSERGARR